MNRNSILVVDDEYDIVGIIKEVLEKRSLALQNLFWPLNISRLL